LPKRIVFCEFASGEGERVRDPDADTRQIRVLHTFGDGVASERASAAKLLWVDRVWREQYRGEPFLDVWSCVGIEAATAVDTTELRDAL
jgi:hypothetical protein